MNELNSVAAQMVELLGDDWKRELIWINLSMALITFAGSLLCIAAVRFSLRRLLTRDDMHEGVKVAFVIIALATGWGGILLVAFGIDSGIDTVKAYTAPHVVALEYLP